MVNIHDVQKSDLPKGDMLEAIFKRQEELMEKYHHIEKENGLLQMDLIPVDLHDRFGQARLKDFAWRFVEEIGEALEAADIHRHEPDHKKEELADALHFLVEFSILAGIKPSKLHSEGDGLVRLYEEARKWYDEGNCEWSIAHVIRYMSQTCNCLKNKPWKQSHILTDVDRFYLNVKKTWLTFIKVCEDFGRMSPEELFALYFGKSDVNKFRQRSKY